MVHFADVWIDIDVINNFVRSSSGNGVKVIVHDHHVFPRIGEQASGIEPGVEAYIAIEKREVTNLKPPYSKVDCVETETEIEYKVISSEINYAYEGCMLDCKLKNIFEKCACHIFDHVDENVCTLADYYFCYLKNQIHVTKCHCLYPCKQTVYDTKLTTLSLPTPMVLLDDRLRNNTYTTKEEIRENMINLKVFYPSLKITKVEQVPAYTFDELLSNVGGQLGLLLGASVLTMGEFIDYLLRFCYYKCKLKRTQTDTSAAPVS